MHSKSTIAALFTVALFVVTFVAIGQALQIELNAAAPIVFAAASHD